MENEKRLIEIPADGVISIQIMFGDTTVGEKRIDLSHYPTVDAVEVKHGRWVLTANEQSNYRWNVTAECSKCHLEKGEIWAGFFPGFPKALAEDIALDNAESVKMDNYCPNCGARMDLNNE